MLYLKYQLVYKNKYMNNYRNFLEQSYAEKLAKSESSEYYNNNFKKDLLFYDNDKELMIKTSSFYKIYIFYIS